MRSWGRDGCISNLVECLELEWFVPVQPAGALAIQCFGPMPRKSLIGPLGLLQMASDHTSDNTSSHPFLAAEDKHRKGAKCSGRLIGKQPRFA